MLHLAFVISAPERVLALRLALTRIIGPESVVLDAGCGPLGLLAIMAARLGARRVVAVDVAPLGFAATLAEENGVAERIDFVQGDLRTAPLPVSSFDVILGMVYHNEIKRDRPQQELMGSLVERHGHSGTAVIPDRVRYSVAGYDCPPADPTNSKTAAEWNTHIDNAERHVGISLSAARGPLDAAGPLFPSVAGEAGSARNRLGYYNRTSMTPLTRREFFTEIRYRHGSQASGSGYPASVALPVIGSGRLNVVVWQQDLVFDDILIRTTESMNLVSPPALVRPGDVATLSTGPDWHDQVPLEISRAGT